MMDARYDRHTNVHDLARALSSLGLRIDPEAIIRDMEAMETVGPVEGLTSASTRTEVQDILSQFDEFNAAMIEIDERLAQGLVPPGAQS